MNKEFEEFAQKARKGQQAMAFFFMQQSMADLVGLGLYKPALVIAEKLDTPETIQLLGDFQVEQQAAHDAFNSLENPGQDLIAMVEGESNPAYRNMLKEIALRQQINSTDPEVYAGIESSLVDHRVVLGIMLGRNAYAYRQARRLSGFVDFPHAQLTAARVYIMQERLNKAESALENALKADGDWSAPYVPEFDAVRHTSSFQRLIKASHILPPNPLNPAVPLGKKQAEAIVARVEANAISRAQMAYLSIIQNYGFQKAYAGELDVARQTGKFVREICPGNFGNFVAGEISATVMNLSGDYQNAAAGLSRMEEWLSYRGRLNYSLALFETGRQDDALEQLKAALRGQPDLVDEIEEPKLPYKNLQGFKSTPLASKYTAIIRDARQALNPPIEGTNRFSKN